MSARGDEGCRKGAFLLHKHCHTPSGIETADKRVGNRASKRKQRACALHTIDPGSRLPQAMRSSTCVRTPSHPSPRRDVCPARSEDRGRGRTAHTASRVERVDAGRLVDDHAHNAEHGRTAVLALNVQPH